MSISLVRPSLSDLFANHEETLKGGMYTIDSVLCSSDRRTLLWGYQRQPNRQVLIERIDDVDAAVAADALRRVSALMALDNKQLAQVIEVFQDKKAIYTVMATGPGSTMAQFNTLSAAQAIEYGVQICGGLNYLHRQGATIACGAVSPDAIFITNHDRVRLTHMGELLGINVVDSAFAPTPCTETCAEVFSVGASLHHVLTGWQGIYRDGAPNLTVLRSDLAPEFAAVIAKSLAQDPAERWQDSMQLRYALLRLQK